MNTSDGAMPSSYARLVFGRGRDRDGPGQCDHCSRMSLDKAARHFDTEQAVFGETPSM